MTTSITEDDTFDALKYKRFGFHPKHYSSIPYTYWVNDNGEFHRKDGPAIITSDGSKYWFLNGQFHCENGPAYEGSDGTKAWIREGNLHRDNGPAVEYPNGTEEWWVNGCHIRK